MPRRNRESELQQAVEAYIAEAEFQAPEKAPLDAKYVAKVLKVSRTTLYQYGLDEILKQASERQREHALEGNLPIHQRSPIVQLHAARESLKDVEVRNTALLARMAIIEANAVRLGIDPEVLYKPILKPVHSVSRAGRRPKRPNGRSS